MLTTSGVIPAGLAAQKMHQQLKLRNNHPKGFQLPQKEKMMSLTSDEKHLLVQKQEGADSLQECRIAQHSYLDGIWISFIIVMVNVEEWQSSIK